MLRTFLGVSVFYFGKSLQEDTCEADDKAHHELLYWLLQFLLSESLCGRVRPQ